MRNLQIQIIVLYDKMKIEGRKKEGIRADTRFMSS